MAGTAINNATINAANVRARMGATLLKNAGNRNYRKAQLSADAEARAENSPCQAKC